MLRRRKRRREVRLSFPITLTMFSQKRAIKWTCSWETWSREMKTRRSWSRKKRRFMNSHLLNTERKHLHLKPRVYPRRSYRNRFMSRNNRLCKLMTKDQKKKQKNTNHPYKRLNFMNYKSNQATNQRWSHLKRTKVINQLTWLLLNWNPRVVRSLTSSSVWRNLPWVRDPVSCLIYLPRRIRKVKTRKVNGISRRKVTTVHIS